MFKILKTIFPVIAGYFAFLCFNFLFEKLFPLRQIDDLGTPGIVFLFEYLVYFIWIPVFIFQFKIVVPRTISSTYKSSIIAIFIGLFIGLFSLAMDFYIDNASFKDALISFFRIFGQFESFWQTNLLSIAIFNYFKAKNIYTN